MDNSPIENRILAFVIKIANTYQAAVSESGKNIIYDHLIDSCVTVGIEVRGYEYAETDIKAVDHLLSAERELTRTLYWLDLLIETGEFQEDEYSALFSEVVDLINLAKETSKMIES